MRTPRFRRYKRTWRLVYPLSATIRLGNKRGRPHFGRLTAPFSISCSNTVTSCCWPGVSTNVTGLPAPSQRTCILVENPPWLLPNASFSGSPFLHRLRAGEHEQRCYLRSGRPTLSSLRRLLVAVTPKVSGPILLLLANGRSDLRSSSKSRSVQASPARERLFWLSKVSRSALFASRCLGGPSLVSGVGAVAVAVPTVRQLAHVFVP